MFNYNIKNYIDNNFDVIYKNVDNIEEAKLIFLGENHSSKLDKEKIARLVDILYLKGTLLLVEGAASCAPVDKQQHVIGNQISSDVKVLGWDMLMTKEKKEEMHEIALGINKLSSLIKNQMNNLGDTKKLFEGTTKIITTLNESALSDIQDENSLRKKITAIEKYRKNLNLIESALVSKSEKVANLIKKREELENIIVDYNYNIFQARTQQMIFTLDICSELADRVFLVAGKHHLQQTSTDERYRLDDFYKNIENIPTIILFPK
jgi:CII-binding regulator of phage lambda lysogenization HflD